MEKKVNIKKKSKRKWGKSEKKRSQARQEKTMMVSNIGIYNRIRVTKKDIRPDFTIDINRRQLKKT